MMHGLANPKFKVSEFHIFFLSKDQTVMLIISAVICLWFI